MDQGGKLGGAGHHDGLGLPAKNGWRRQFQVLGSLHVCGDVEHAQQLGHVGELGEAGHGAEAGAVRGQLDGGDDFAEGGRPGVEVVDACGGEEVGPQVVLHHVGLGDRVRDGGGCGERGAASARVVPAEPVELHVEVLGPVGAVDPGGGDVRLGVQVLEQVGLVQEHVIDAGLLEAHAVVFGTSKLLLDLFLLDEQLAFQAFHRQPASRPGTLDPCP